MCTCGHLYFLLKGFKHLESSYRKRNTCVHDYMWSPLFPSEGFQASSVFLQKEEYMRTCGHLYFLLKGFKHLESSYRKRNTCVHVVTFISF